ncbi:hypothetical protein B0I37DRAFT_59016 [Chaetomium sp. MPI-CAGE-AT-0009]|nr:hypothetical protein B0I37DRAFT_59016 [Chaetomium sp. MPI-CAGE-AT-0009]
MTTDTLAASQGQNLSQSSKVHFPVDPKLPGKSFEPRQNFTTGDYTPNPSKSLPLSPARRALVNDIISLYEMGATVERVQRYTPDAVYHGELGYADDRYQIAGQWFGLPYIFREAKSRGPGHEVVINDMELIQFRHEIEWLPKIVPKMIKLRSLVSLALDSATADDEFIRVKYHKGQASVGDYGKEGIGAMLKRWQAEAAARVLSSVYSDLGAFASDKAAGR